MQVSNNWKEYKCIDAGNSEKVESWNGIILRRPDPQAMWPNLKNSDVWNNVDGFYHRSNKGGGYWDFNKKLPEFWNIHYRELTFKVSPTGFKHTGLFPEQAFNWDYMIDKIQNSKRKVKVLNLFAYTGGTTMACSFAGAEEVVHVDSSKGIVAWAKENMNLSHLENNRIRFIVDDCLKFVEREIRRGNKYDAIIMDPPSYGRGPSGEMWKFEENITELIDKCTQILSDDPLFFIINCYTTGVGITAMKNILSMSILKKYPNGIISADEIGLKIDDTNLILPCGSYGRWEKQD